MKPKTEENPAPGTIGLDDFAMELLALYDGPAKSGPTRDKMRQTIGQVANLRGVDRIADLTPQLVAAWVRTMIDEGLSRATIETRLANLRAACSYAVRRGHLDRNPVEAQRHWLPHGYEGRPAERPDALAEDDADRLMVYLLDSSDTWEAHRLLALAAVVLYAGLRRNEALRLDVADCDLTARTLRIVGASIGRRERPMPAKLSEVLADWLPNTGCRWAFPGARLVGPWNGGPPGQKPLHRLRDAGRDVGLEGVSFERLRGTWTLAGGRPALPLFEGRSAPRRTYEGPCPKPPGPPPKPTEPPGTWAPAIEFPGPGRIAVIAGRVRREFPATDGLCKALAALAEAGRDGLSAKELNAICRPYSWRQMLIRLKKTDPLLDAAIIFAGRPYLPYRMASRAEVTDVYRVSPLNLKAARC